MTRARKALRSRAYVSSGSKLSRLIMGRAGLRVCGLQAARPQPPVGLQVAVQLDQRLAVDLALEVDHRIQGDPVVVPAPGVELRVAARAQLDVAVAPHHAQQIPDLLLAAVRRAD